MKAAVLTGQRQITIREVPKPEPGPGEVLVKVEYAGICGSDVHAYKNLIFPVGTILGHEFTGTVAAVGSAVSGLRPGQRVVARPAGICGECEWCHRGSWPCASTIWKNTPGLKLPGGFAEYVKLYDYQAIPLPDAISLQEGAQLEPLAVCSRGVHATPRGPASPPSSSGRGPSGSSSSSWRGSPGQGRLPSWRNPRAAARKQGELGAEHVLEPSGDLVRRIRDREKNGPSVVFDCVGNEETVNCSLELVKSGGRVVMIGASAKPFPVNQLRWLQRGITVIASMGYFVDDFAAAIALLEKKARGRGDPRLPGHSARRNREGDPEPGRPRTGVESAGQALTEERRRPETLPPSAKKMLLRANVPEEELNGVEARIGEHIELVIEDSKGVPKESMAAANKLISRDRVPLIMGDFTSSSTFASAEVCERRASRSFLLFPPLPS